MKKIVIEASEFVGGSKVIFLGSNIVVVVIDAKMVWRNELMGWPFLVLKEAAWPNGCGS